MVQDIYLMKDTSKWLLQFFWCSEQQD